MNISKNFLLREFLRSDAAARAGRVIEPDSRIINNLVRLCNEILEPLRADMGLPVRILSGYRPPWLNQMVGGSRSSEHMDGRAADIEIVGIADEVLCERIVSLHLPYNQVILEFPPSGWCHVSIAEFGHQPRREALTATRRSSRVVYLSGITAKAAA